MSSVRRSVSGRYGDDGILDPSLRARAELGKDLDSPAPLDLTPVDAFHIRDRDATVERAKVGLWP